MILFKVRYLCFFLTTLSLFGENPDKDWSFGFGGSFIVWGSHASGLVTSYDFAESNRFDNQLSVYTPPSDLYYGFKLALLAEVLQSNLCLEYTWFRNGNDIGSIPSLSTPQDNASDLFPLWGDWEDAERFSGCNSFWQIDFGRLDLRSENLITSREYFEINCCWGIAAGWEDQTYKITYTYGDLSRLFSNRQSWWGVAPLVGISTETFLKDTFFSLFVKSALGIFCSNFDIASTEIDLDTSDSCSEYSDSFFRALPMLESFVGVKLDGMVTLVVGWEEQLWLGHNGMKSNYNMAIKRGNYSTSGLTFSVVVGF